MYSVVIFAVDHPKQPHEEVEVIATSWLVQPDAKLAYWPPFKKSTAITSAIKNVMSPTTEWDRFKIRKVVGQYGQYDGPRNYKKNGVLGPNVFCQMYLILCWKIGVQSWPSSQIVKWGRDPSASEKWDLNNMADISHATFSDLVLLLRFKCCWSWLKLLLAECHRTHFMTSQHQFRKCLDVWRHQAIAWANVDPDLCSHMPSLGHNKPIL